MTDLNIDGMVIAPGVVETIVSLAVQNVEGVACVGDPTTSGIMSVFGGGKPSTQGVEVDSDADGDLHVTVSVNVKSGYVLPDLATDIRRAIADAVNSQIGIKVGSVDVFVDGIQFAN